VYSCIADADQLILYSCNFDAEADEYAQEARPIKVKDADDTNGSERPTSLCHSDLFVCDGKRESICASDGPVT